MYHHEYRFFRGTVSAEIYSNNSLIMHFYEKLIRIKVVLFAEIFQIVVTKFGPNNIYR